jgi:hypothetical protein
MADMKPLIRQPMNKKDGARVTLRLTAEQEAQLHRLDRKVRRQFVPALRRKVDPILTKLENHK